MSSGVTRSWLGVASRSIAAIGGGYAIAALVAMACAAFLPIGRLDAVLAGMLLSLLIQAGAAIWVFAARSATRAWIGLLLLGVPLYTALSIHRAAWPW